MKYNEDEIWQVALEMFKLKEWINIKTKKKDLTCSECKKRYEDLGEKVAMMTIHNRPNVHLCNSCGRKYIELGAVDINKEREDNRLKKERLIKEISSMKQVRNIKDKTIKELEEIYPKIKKEHEDEIDRQQKIKESQPTEKEWEIEQWLIDQYNVIQDKKYLTSEFKIEEYFKDTGRNYLECGQGYYEDEANLLVKIGSKFFSVDIIGEVGSSKQDRGDRLYWIENIESVSYKEIDKPIKKPEEWVNFNIKISTDNKNLLEKYLKRKQIEFKLN